MIWTFHSIYIWKVGLKPLPYYGIVLLITPDLEPQFSQYATTSQTYAESMDKQHTPSHDETLCPTLLHCIPAK